MRGKENSTDPKEKFSLDSKQNLVKDIVVDAYEMGQNLIGTNDLDQALIWFNAVKKDHPQYLNALLEKAFILVARRLNNEVIEICEILLKAQPENVDAYFLEGVAYNNQGDEKQALTYFDKAIELGGSSRCAAEALFRRGTILEKREELYQALECYKKAQAINREDERIISSIRRVQKQINLNNSLEHAISNTDVKEVEKLVAQGAKPCDNIDNIIEFLSARVDHLNFYRGKSEQYRSLSNSVDYSDPNEKFYIPFPLKKPTYGASDIHDILRALNLSNQYEVASVKKGQDSFGLPEFEYKLKKVPESLARLLSKCALTTSNTRQQETKLDRECKILRQKLADVISIEKLNFKLIQSDFIILEFPKDSKLTLEEINKIASGLNKLGLAGFGIDLNGYDIFIDERPGGSLKFYLSAATQLELAEKLSKSSTQSLSFSFI